MSLIKLDNVSKFYKSGDGVSVGMRKISTEFNLGEFVAVTGESGSGKSTLLNVISGLDSYEDGEIYIQNEETSHYTNKDWELYRAKYIGFIFQSYNIIDSYSVYQNVMLALEIQNYPRHLRKQRALELIEKVGLKSHTHHKAAKLSGGQKQRAVIARALAKDCPIIVADEPTGNLDSESSKQIIDLLHEVSKEKLVVIVTHDFDQVKQYATRKIKMHDGEMVEDKVLKKTEAPQTPEQPTLKAMTVPSVIKFSLRNLFTTPRRTFFFLLFQIVIMTVFTFAYTFLMDQARNNLFGAGYTGGNSNYFEFYTDWTTDNRFYVLRKDNQTMTASDYNALSALQGGNHYVYKDFTYIDINNFSNLQVYADDSTFQLYNFKLDTTYSISNTPQFIIEGRMPEEQNEIVVSNMYQNINVGDEIDFFGNRRVYLETPAQIVGDYITFEYTNEDNYHEIKIKFKDGSYTRIEGFFYENFSIPQFTGRAASDVEEFSVYVERYINDYQRLIVVGKYNDNNKGALYLSHDFLDSPFLGNGFMIAARTQVQAERIFDNIDKNIYRVVYPELDKGTIQSLFGPINFIVSLIFYALVFFFALFMYFILYTVVRNIMQARKKDFAIFRSIGANQSKLGWLVIFEQLIVMMISFAIAMIILSSISYSNFVVNKLLSILTMTDYMIIFLTFTYLTLWLARRFNKRTFKFSIIENIQESKEETL